MHRMSRRNQLRLRRLKVMMVKTSQVSIPLQALSTVTCRRCLHLIWRLPALRISKFGMHLKVFSILLEFSVQRRRKHCPGLLLSQALRIATIQGRAMLLRLLRRVEDLCLRCRDRAASGHHPQYPMQCHWIHRAMTVLEEALTPID